MTMVLTYVAQTLTTSTSSRDNLKLRINVKHPQNVTPHRHKSFPMGTGIARNCQKSKRIQAKNNNL